MTGDRLLYCVVGLLCVGMGVFIKRLRLRRGNRYAPQWFATLWRVWLIIVGLVLIFLILLDKGSRETRGSQGDRGATRLK